MRVAWGRSMRSEGAILKMPVPRQRTRRPIRRYKTLEKRLAALIEQVRRLESAQEQVAIDSELAPYWRTFERLRRYPTEKNAKAAKRAYRFLAKRYHPDHGGNHRDFVRLKDTYDRALAVWRKVAR
jgi:DNA phosphorothioation-dependent restriction protein DptG